MKRRPLFSFSIVELLLVLAIIGILSALLMPAYKSMRESARAANCMSNMRQIGIGLVNYSMDNNGYFPPANTNSNLKPPPTALNNWIGMVWPYVNSTTNYLAGVNDGTVLSKNKNVFSCPTAKLYPVIAKKTAIRVPGGQANGDNNRSYGMNVMTSWSYYGLPNPKLHEDGRQFPMNRSWVTNAPGTMLIIEDTQLQSTPDLYFYTKGKYGRKGSGTGLIPHHGGCNILFYDGHTEFYVYRNIPTNKGPIEPPFWTGQ
jgi:prepilin-type processing-associated H-X9-DG protein